MPSMLKPPKPDNVTTQASNCQAELEHIGHFNRSPHPYSRSQYTGLTDEHQDNSGEGSSAAVSSRSESGPETESTRYDRGLKITQSASASESGTEADDEGYSFVKALPPANVRPRKGLRNAEQTEGTTTPLLTPSQLDADSRRRSDGYFRWRTSAEGARKDADEEEQRAVRARSTTRRRAEYIRRMLEGLLLGVIGITVACEDGVILRSWQYQDVLFAHVATVLSLVVSYPLRLTVFHQSPSQLEIWRPWHSFRVPASFDPASILYPTFLPVLVALSLSRESPYLILPSTILGLAALPVRLFPEGSHLHGYNALHWFVSLVPLLVAKRSRKDSSDFDRFLSVRLNEDPSLIASSEFLTLLYPLHEALLPALHFVTTTSLLPAELQLLSTSLTSLLIFATSPQAIILATILWMGGLGIYISCGHVLHWGVLLARIPRWRLRRSITTVPSHNVLREIFEAFLRISRRQRVLGSKDILSDSDADEDGLTLGHGCSEGSVLKVHTLDTNLAASAASNRKEPRSAVEPRSQGMDSTAVDPLVKAWAYKRRSVTALSQEHLTSRHLSAARHKRRRSSVRNAFLHMTANQAKTRKWLYAGWIYFAIVVLVGFPIRLYVASHALSGVEPVGWALAYILGGLPGFRDFITGYNLTPWIPLPALEISCGLRTQRSQAVDGLLRPVAYLLSGLTVGSSNVRLAVIAHWLAVLTTGLTIILSLPEHVEVDTRRKTFHAVMVIMFLPTAFVDPCFCALALCLVLAVFLMLEVLRAGQVPPVGSAVGRFIAPYVDGRDLRGPVVVSHVFLLVGCAVPLWLSLAGMERSSDWGAFSGWETKQQTRETAMIAGIVCVGMGDAAASLIGRRFGRRKWGWVGGKSLEGSAAFAAAVTVGLMAGKLWLQFWGWNDAGMKVGSLLCWTLALCKAAFCACGASFMEAVLTGGNDNVIVPIALWLLARGVGL
ncbi:dolichol kinase [Elasticomyces elasticus]|nr:dolichol kinase [Elasticomyces elasticus]